MADIDVGQEVSINSALDDNTLISFDNPANAGGTIDYIKVNTNEGTPGPAKVASFEPKGGADFATRGYATISVVNGINELNAPGDFTAFAIETGDYIGYYSLDNDLATRYNSYGGMWYEAADKIPTAQFTFGWAAVWGLYLYCEGTAGPPPGNPFPIDWLKKKVITGYHCFMGGYLNAKRTGYDPLKLPDGTIF